MDSQIINYKKWLTRQNDIYNEISQQAHSVEKNGLQPNPKILKGEGGYLIALIHSDSINKRVFEVSSNIRKIIPSIVYKPEDVHTTLSDYSVQPNFSPDNNILNKLKDIATRLNLAKYKPIIIYDRWLNNQDSVIAAGNPNKYFFKLAGEIIKLGKSLGITLRWPKMAHITTNRFIEVSSSDKVKELKELLEKTKVLGISKPEKLAVGYFLTNKKSFTFYIYKEFVLNQ